MLLKRLELQGFKSFADKTVLEFSDGATAVVGPNGSGKSNISDAIRWVMGEMSAKTLRGSNMQDVIFAGTESRGRVNFAEVSLVLDNSEKIFPLEYDELVVTRRVFRSGETAYRINGTNCRLKDIHELFMDTGLGRDGYSIIGQGNVAQILSTKAEERRNLFEEAAGVAKYKYKKEEASRKLSQVEDNILRITDIAAELESQLVPLEKQSEKARKYLIYYEEYKALDVNMALVTLKRNNAENEKFEQLNNSVNAEIAGIREREAETEAKISELYEASKRKDDEQQQKNAELVEVQGKTKECEKDISISLNTIKNNENMLVRIEAEIENTLKRNKQRKEEKKELEKKAAFAQNGLTLELEKLTAIQKEESEIAYKQDSLNKKINEINEKISLLSNTAATEKTRAEGIEALRSNYISRREAIEAQLTAINSEIEKTKNEIEESNARKEEISGKLLKLENMISALEEKKNGKEADISGLSKELERLRVESNSKISKRRMLEAMENEYDGYARSVKAVLKSDELKKLEIYGTVAGLIDVKKEYAVAIEIALGNALQNIIVETEEDAKEAISYLKRTNSGRVTFLPVTSIKGRSLENVNSVKNEKGFVGVGSDLVSVNSKYKEIIKSLLGRIVIAENIECGISISRKYGYKFKVVTLSGEVLNSGGAMTGGSVNKTSGFLSRAAEIKALKADISDIERKLMQINERKEKEEGEVRLIISQMSSYMPMKREYEDEILKLQNTVKHLSGTVFAGSGTEKDYGKELSDIEENLLKSADSFAEALNNVRNAQKNQKEEEEQLCRLREEAEAMSNQRSAVNNAVIEQNKKISEYKSDLYNSEERAEQIKNEILQAETENKLKNNDKEKVQTANSELAAAVEEKKSEMKQLENRITDITQSIAVISEEKKQIVSKLQEIQNSNKEITDTLIKLQQELSRVEAKQVKLTMEKDNILNRLWEDYEFTYSQIAETAREPENVREAEIRLEELKRKIKGLGSVNIDSIEEYKNVSERYEFLSKQKEDLDKSKINLNQIIISMEELMKEHFAEQFNAISESFSIVFRELFGGGRGKLYLQDPDNILETGIEIEVQLPGKGLQNINLYSGGEKSFIAIALLFSILRVKPSPFCILDEIDAALDDVNVSRFATYLKNYIDNSQFIVITHRRGTMEAANILYGVTMQEKGVSKLLSLNIDDVDENMAK